ncbi:hypothetical protein Glove_120g146 [Diversispora epigaea]|uniref:Uncharacterized protein n=1 Tax=Diversispora epigaea TaxID=1348612 RepID=A0A397IZK1_9GLOM|nr:hypothetical protein Glove_120g146 [Diversispora epigaea]
MGVVNNQFHTPKEETLPTGFTKRRRVAHTRAFLQTETVLVGVVNINSMLPRKVISQRVLIKINHHFDWRGSHVHINKTRHVKSYEQENYYGAKDSGFLLLLC